VHYSQTDLRWSFYSVRGDHTISIGRCGCLLSAFSTVLNHESGMLPWFITPFDYFGGTLSSFDFNPRYMDLFFMYGPNPAGTPGSPSGFPVGWGYKNRPEG